MTNVLINHNYLVLIIGVAVVFILACVYFCYFWGMLSHFRRTTGAKTQKEKDILTADVAYFCEIGQRERQEDSVYISQLDEYRDHGLFSCIADGMGGLKEGHLISQYVVDEIEKLYPIDFDSHEYIARKISQISRRIYDTFKLKGGSTLALIHIFDNRLKFYSVGDSNVILIRNDTATVLNYKQNYVGDLIRRLSKQNQSTKDAYLDKDAAALVDFIGKNNIRVIYTRDSLRLIDGDTLIICSDGVTDTLPVEHFAKYIDSSAKLTAKKIKENVLNKKLKKQDNFSAVVIQLKRSKF